MTGPHNLKPCYVTLNTNIRGHLKANSRYALPLYKIENCSFSDSKRMKEDPKRKKYGNLGLVKDIDKGR